MPKNYEATQSLDLSTRVLAYSVVQVGWGALLGYDQERGLVEPLHSCSDVTALVTKVVGDASDYLTMMLIMPNIERTSGVRCRPLLSWCLAQIWMALNWLKLLRLCLRRLAS